MGLIVKQETPSAKICSRILFEERDELAVAITLLRKSSSFLSHNEPLIEISTSSSSSNVFTSKLSLVFSVSSPRIRELILLMIHGSNL